MTVICISITSSDISPFTCFIYYNARNVVIIQGNKEVKIRRKFINNSFLIINDSKNNNQVMVLNIKESNIDMENINKKNLGF